MEKQNTEPKLRFPEFSIEWEKKKLGDLFQNRRQKGNEFIPIFSVTQDRGLVSRDTLDRKMQNDAKPEDNLYVESNDLVYNMMRMWQGAIGISSQTCMVSPAYIVLKPYENVSSKFFIQLFQKNRSLYLFTSYSYGLTSDRLRLYYKDFSDIKFYIPQYSEQQKVSNFLSTIDDKLTQLKKKKSLLEQYKKVVMQKIFSQELRFIDENGEDFKDWEEKSLGEIGETYNGLTGKSKENFGSGKPYIQYKQIFDDTKIDISRFEYVEINNNEKQKKVKFGDVFFTVSSETPDEVGMSSVLLNNIDELYLNSFCFGYRLFSFDVLNPNYARYLFRSDLFRKEVITLAQGSTRYNLSKIGMMKLKINLPSLHEQTKIFNFLSTLDDKINNYVTQIVKIEGWKKGLLQLMFV